MSRETKGPPVVSGRPEVGDEVVAKRRDAYTPNDGPGPTVDELAAFHAKSDGAFDLYFVRSGDVATSVIADRMANPLSAALFGVIRRWYRITAPDRRECLTCGRAFGETRAPAGFAVIVQHRPGPRDALCGPMCRRCCARSNDGALAAAVEALRGIWPDLREATGEGGNA